MCCFILFIGNYVPVKPARLTAVLSSSVFILCVRSRNMPAEPSPLALQVGSLIFFILQTGHCLLSVCHHKMLLDLNMRIFFLLFLYVGFD